jgi:2-polyprenyl-3-methyl-5-hydroxy-6-metoxy-1,4-benzoquinol methylase
MVRDCGGHIFNFCFLSNNLGSVVLDLGLGHPCLKRIVDEVLLAWPAHGRFVQKSLSGHSAQELGIIEELAEDICKISNEDLAQMAASYKGMCESFLEEEIFFRRNGVYRCSSFKEAQREVYDNNAFMKIYMEGLLLSQVLWNNHAKGFIFFVRELLGRISPKSRYLEIGPGHGLYLAWAARHQQTPVTGWDVSNESLKLTSQSLGALGMSGSVQLERKDVLEVSDKASFDVITISEVLEHLEQPQLALEKLYQLLVPGGLVFVNMPVNSPAPDHIYLLKAPTEVRELIRSSGFEVVAHDDAPMTGLSIERALKTGSTISCAAIGRRP